MLKKAEEQGNLLRVIVNWSCVSRRAQKNPCHVDNNFGSNFSLFQLKKTTFDQHCWPKLVFIQKMFLLVKDMYVKDSNFAPFCFLIKSVLRRREHKVEKI